MSTATAPSKTPPVARVITTKPRFSDKVFRAVVTAGGLSSLVILAVIAFFLVYNGFGVFKSEGLSFFTGFEWVDAQPDAGTPASYGIGAMLYGTLLTGFLAVLFGVPIAVGAALFLSYYAPEWLKKPMVIVVDVMAAIPSIVYGLWGYFVFMPHAEYWAKLIHKYFGFIPFFDMPTPLDRIQAAFALGATKWSMIKAVVFPYGAGGVVGGAMLGLGRALGETVAVYTVLNLVYDIRIEVLLSAGGNVASMIVNKFGEADAPELKALMAAGFVLFLVTLIVNFIANIIINRTARKG